MTAKVPQQPPPPYSEIPPGSTQENYQPIPTEASFNHQHACKIFLNKILSDYVLQYFAF